MKDLLDKLALKTKNIIFDEVQTLQEGSSVSVSLWENKNGHEHSFDLRPYAKLKEFYPMMQRFLDKVAEIINSVQPEVERLKNESVVDYFRKLMALPVQNPAFTRNIEKTKKLQAEAHSEKEKLQAERESLQKLYPDKTAFEILMMLPEIARPEIPKAMEEVMSEDIPFNEIVKIQEVLIQVIQKPKEYELREDQIIMLSKLLLIVNSHSFTVSYVRGLDGEQISIQAQDTLLFKAIQMFISRALQDSKEKRVIFTTATFGSLRIDKLLNLPNMKDVIWGDPMNTSLKLLVVADKSRISPYNFLKKLKDVKALIKAVIEKYGQENVAICTMNKEWSRRLGVGSTWYQSDETEGVASRQRIWIFVGLAEKPVNAKDHLAIIQAPYHENPLKLQGKDFLHYISQMLRIDSVNINSFQAISRAKDPEAKDRSVAIMIGARAEDVDRCLLWGPTRILKPENSERGLKFTVDIQEPIGKPLLTTAPLSTNIDESLHIIDWWITHGEVESYQLNWVYLKRFIDDQGYVSIKRLVKVNGLDEKETHQFFERLPAFFEKQNVTGYVLIHDSYGEIKGISTRSYYESKKKSGIIAMAPQHDSAIQTNDWFIALKAAVNRAQNDLSKLTPGYFSQHVSTPAYSHLDEFMDAIESSPHLCTGWLILGKKTDGRNNRWLAKDLPCFGAWTPDFPRRFGSPDQSWVDNATDLLQIAIQSNKVKSDCFVSVYAFPDHKHPKDGGNPPISTIFIDLDIESNELTKLKKRWENEDDSNCLEELKSLRLSLLAEVLKQAKAVVDYLRTLEIEPRILLSAGKGLHIFLDFQRIQFSSPKVAKDIIKQFLEQIAKGASKKSGYKIVFDPSVIGDLSRLCRIPNTPNSKATKLLGHDTYAVPITAEELAILTPTYYDTLCSSTRYLQIERRESLVVLEMLTKISKEIDFADDDTTQLRRPTLTPKASVRNSRKIDEYERECTREILADDDFDELDIRPCFKKVHSERISLNGGEGHMMRIGAVMELAGKGLSIPSIVRWFGFCADYDELITEKAVIDLISRGYTDKHMDEDGSERRKGLKCKTIQGYGFCLNENCHIYCKKFGGR